MYCRSVIVILLIRWVGVEGAVSPVSSSLQPSMKAFRIQPAQFLQPQFKLSPASPSNVLTVAKSNSASKFVQLVEKTPWLSKTLEDNVGDSVTVFAFSDNAYDRSSAAVKAALADRWNMEAILQYHVAVGAHLSSEIAVHGVDVPLYSFFPSPPLSPSTAYQPIHVDTYWVYSSGILETVVTASGAPVIKADLAASNGVVHIIDKVMYPVPTGSDAAKYLQEEPQYSMLYAALQKANMTSTLSTQPFKPLTIFAPSNEAFGKLNPAQAKLLQNVTILQRVLAYHVVMGSYYRAAIYNDFQLHPLEGSTIYFEVGAGGVSAEGKQLENFDTTVTNGVVHELAGVMFPTSVAKLLIND